MVSASKSGPFDFEVSIQSPIYTYKCSTGYSNSFAGSIINMCMNLWSLIPDASGMQHVLLLIKSTMLQTRVLEGGKYDW